MLGTILFVVLIFLLGVGLGVFVSRFIVKREFEKNPPISEEMIAAMLQGMGQTPTKKRVNQIMKQMKGAKK